MQIEAASTCCFLLCGSSNMKYYRFDNDELHANGTTYVEVDKDGCAFRQITVGGGQFIASNIRHPQWGFCLPEGCVDYDDWEEFVPITQQDFNVVWNQHLARSTHQWETTRARYPVGKPITGALAIFYPQGAIVDLGSDALAVADYAECRASAQPEWMYPKHRVRAVVAGYDEENQWVELREPRVESSRSDSE